jgi:hypothetical protein
MEEKEKVDWKSAVILMVIIIANLYLCKLIFLDFLPWFIGTLGIKGLVINQLITFVIYIFVKNGQISFFVWPGK